MKILSNKQLEIKINSLGAELSSIIKKDSGKQYMWQADPEYWKRHSPVLFPIVGSLWNNEYRIDGKEYHLSQHGFARDMIFNILDSTENSVFYLLENNNETLQKYPYPFQLKIGYKLTDNRIEVIWEVKNTGENSMYFQIGAHPAFYFPMFDPSEDLKGYFSFDKNELLTYILIKEKGCVSPDTYHIDMEEGLLPITRHTFDKDALIFEDSQLAKVTLFNKLKQPHLSLFFDAPVVGLWSPAGKDAPFFCIEPWYGRCDKIDYTGEFKDKDWINHLSPGEIFSASYTIEIY